MIKFSVFFRSFKSHSKLTHKLLSQIIWLETVSFICILLLILCFILPSSKSSATKQANYLSSICINQLDSVIYEAFNYCNGIMSSSTIKGYLANYLKQASDKNYKELLRLELNSYISSKSRLRHMILLVDGTVSFDSITNSSPLNYHVINSPEYKKLSKNIKSSLVSPIYFSSDTEKYSIACSKNFTFMQHNITITMFLDVTEEMNNLIELTKPLFNDYIIYDSFGKELYEKNGTDTASNHTLSFNTASSDSISIFKGGFLNIHGSHSLCSIVSYTTPALFYQQTYRYFFILFLFYILIYILTILIMKPTLTLSLDPIRELFGSMSMVSTGDLSIRSKVRADNEIGELGSIFNSMIERLEEQANSLLTTEQEKQKMQYSLLISQINPHFIFNTMNNVSILAKMQRTDDIILLNNALIDLLKDRLRISADDNYDTLEQELFILKRYITAFEYGYTTEVTYTFNIAEEVTPCKIPKNILQPILENSFLHGLYDEDTGVISGSVSIDAYKDNGYIMIEIKDNGIGINADLLNYLNAPYDPLSVSRMIRGLHIGLSNIRQQLSLLYPKEQRLYFNSLPEGGTSVTIQLDIIQ